MVEIRIEVNKREGEREKVENTHGIYQFQRHFRIVHLNSVDDIKMAMLMVMAVDSKCHINKQKDSNRINH